MRKLYFQTQKGFDFRVFEGDINSRIEAIAREQHISKRDAEEYVNNLDDSRIRYHKYYTGLTWGNAEDYDLCLDCVRLGAEKSVKIISEYIENVAL